MKNFIVVGKMASGKTTVANWLRDVYGYQVVSLAGPIKEVEVGLGLEPPEYLVDTFLAPYYPFTETQRKIALQILEEARDMPRETPKPRKRLQFIGTEGFRNRIDGQFWIKITNESCQVGGPYIIDDVRFHNEFDFFVANKWEPIGLVVSEDVQCLRLKELYGEFDPAILHHASEVDIRHILSRLYYAPVNTDRPSVETISDIHRQLQRRKVL